MNGTAVVQAKANEKGRIEFGLESAIDSSVRATPERLRELGSEGLARRYELLLEQDLTCDQSPPSPRLPWLTRARVLVGLPIAGVIVLMTPLVGVFLLPRWQDVQEVQQRRDTLLELQRNLPSLERNLEASKVVLVQAQQQQGLLLSLIAGRARCKPLALLNQQARQSGVTIRRYEPIKTTGPSSASKQTSNKAEDDVTPLDPLQSLGYQKSSVALAVTGPFAGLQQFLQRMEALELLVESSDLELKAAVKQDKNQTRSEPPVESTTQLTMQLSFYDLQTSGDLNSDNSKVNPPN